MILYIGTPPLKLKAFLSQEIVEFLERNSHILSQKLLSYPPTAQDFDFSPEIGISPKNHLKHFRKASFKNPKLLTIHPHCRRISAFPDPIIQITPSQEELQERTLIKTLIQLLTKIRVVIAPLNNLFFLNNLFYSKTKQSPLTNSPDISEKYRYLILKALFQNEIKPNMNPLCNYLTWKQKKWLAKFQRNQVLKQREKLEFQEIVVCKICDAKVPELNLLSHSSLCKKLEDFKEKSNKNVNLLSNKYLQVLGDLRRTYSIKATIIKNRMHRLESKIRKIENPKFSDEEPDEEGGFNLKKERIKPLDYLSEDVIPLDTSIICINLHTVPLTNSNDNNNNSMDNNNINSHDNIINSHDNFNNSNDNVNNSNDNNFIGSLNDHSNLNSFNIASIHDSLSNPAMPKLSLFNNNESTNTDSLLNNPTNSNSNNQAFLQATNNQLISISLNNLETIHHSPNHIFNAFDLTHNEFKEDSCEDNYSSENLTPMNISTDFSHKITQLKLLNLKKNQPFLSKEELTLDEPNPTKYRRSCLETRKLPKEVNEGVLRMKVLLEEETNLLKVNKRVLKYLDILLSLLNIYITMSLEAPSSAYLKLQQYFQNNSRLLRSLKDWILQKDALKTYDGIWNSSQEVMSVLLLQNTNYIEILDAEKKLKSLAIPSRPLNIVKNNRSLSQQVKLDLLKANEIKNDNFLTSGSQKHTLYTGELYTPKYNSLTKTFNYKSKKDSLSSFNEKNPKDFININENERISILSKNNQMYSFEESPNSKKPNDQFTFEGSPTRLRRSTKRTITVIEAPVRQERMSFLRTPRTGGVVHRSKTYIHGLDMAAFGNPSYNIIENFINDNTISWGNKKKVMKAVLDNPLCVGGNYIECYNSDGALMNLKRKRGKKELRKGGGDSDSGSSEEGDFEIGYASDQMEKNHINAIKLKENKYFNYIFDYSYYYLSSVLKALK